MPGGHRSQMSAGCWRGFLWVPGAQGGRGCRHGGSSAWIRGQGFQWGRAHPRALQPLIGTVPSCWGQTPRCASDSVLGPGPAGSCRGWASASCSQVFLTSCAGHSDPGFTVTCQRPAAIASLYTACHPLLGMLGLGQPSAFPLHPHAAVGKDLTDRLDLGKAVDLGQ